MKKKVLIILMTLLVVTLVYSPAEITGVFNSSIQEKELGASLSSDGSANSAILKLTPSASSIAFSEENGGEAEKTSPDEMMIKHSKEEVYGKKDSKNGDYGTTTTNSNEKSNNDLIRDQDNVTRSDKPDGNSINEVIQVPVLHTQPNQYAAEENTVKQVIPSVEPNVMVMAPKGSHSFSSSDNKDMKENETKPYSEHNWVLNSIDSDGKENNASNLESPVEFVNKNKDIISPDKNMDEEEYGPALDEWIEVKISQYIDEIDSKDLKDFRIIMSKLDQEMIRQLTTNGLEIEEQEVLKKHMRERLSNEEIERSKGLFKIYSFVLKDL